MPSAAITSTMHALSSSRPSVGPYCSAAARGVDGHARHQRGEVLGRERARVRQPAGQRDDLRLGGDRHQVAHRRGLHALRAAGEQPGVALEVAGGGSGRAHPCVLRRRPPGPLASRLWSCRRETRYRPWTSSSISFRAPASPPAIGIRPFLPGAARRRARGRRPRHRLRRHRLLLPRAVRRSCSRRRRAGWRSPTSRPPLRAGRAGRRPRPAAARRPWPVVARRAGWRRARSPTTTTRSSPGADRRRAVRGARLRGDARSLFAACAAASTPRPPARSPSTPRASALARRRAVRPVPAARARS